MLAGLAKVDITAPLGTDMTGYLARFGPAIGVHDPIHCRVLVFDDGHGQAAIVVNDTLGFGIEYTKQAKAFIAKETGISVERIMLSGTHTHSGPASVYLQDCGNLAIEWLGSLPDKFAQAVKAAQAALEEVTLFTGSTIVTDVAVNRREPGRGPLDETLRVLWLQTKSGSVKGVLLQYACHAVVLDGDNQLFSADWPGAACRCVEDALGAGCLFMQGPCGDINPLQSKRGSFDFVEEIGSRIGAAAVAVIQGQKGQAVAAERVLVENEETIFPLGPIPDYSELVNIRQENRVAYEQAQSKGEVMAAKVARSMWHWAEHALSGYCTAMIQNEVKVTLQSFAVGNVRLIAVPGELFVQYGIDAMQNAVNQGKFAIVAAYSNGDVGYIPTAGSYEKGGYEVTSAYSYYGYPAAVTAEAGKRVAFFIEKAINL